MAPSIYHDALLMHHLADMFPLNFPPASERRLGEPVRGRNYHKPLQIRLTTRSPFRIRRGLVTTSYSTSKPQVRLTGRCQNGESADIAGVQRPPDNAVAIKEAVQLLAHKLTRQELIVRMTQLVLSELLVVVIWCSIYAAWNQGSTAAPRRLGMDSRMQVFGLLRNLQGRRGIGWPGALVTGAAAST